MSRKETFAYKLIETQAALLDFVAAHQQAEWLAFDTEFIGEKRYQALLCLIQIASPSGYYLIDPLGLKSLNPFLALLTNPKILKITHAGENDYKILYQDFGIVPKNIFDTQLAAGFVGYNYPVSFQRLVEQELNVSLDKSYVVADWEARPLQQKAIDYALNDVVYLHRLYMKLSSYLNKNQRFAWLKSELTHWECATFYERDPHLEALNSNLMLGLRRNKQVFLLRLYEWRRKEAKRLNCSKEMVFPARHFGAILKGVENGKQSLLDNRTIPNNLVSQYWATFESLYRPAITPEEVEILKKLPPPATVETARQAVSMELLHTLVKYKCVEMGVASSLVMNKSDLTTAEQGKDMFAVQDWRIELLGADLVDWINKRGELTIAMSKGKVILTMP